MRRRVVALAAAAGLLAGCPVGPNYKRPELDIPKEYRSEIQPAEAASFADVPWWDIFNDPILRELIEEALRNNHDLQAAIERVEQSRALVGVARSDIFPQVNYEGGAAREKAFFPVTGVNPTFNSFLGVFNLAWEIDVWGRIRRLTEAARDEFYASEDFQRSVVLILVSDVAQAYFELQELDTELEIAHRNVASFQDTLDLFERQLRGGVASKLSVARAEAALAQTAAAVPEVERLIVVKENQISILLGRNPGPIPRGPNLVQSAVAPQTPPGLPSELLERRPDIRQAEQLMAAANARIGVAEANFFPRIGLTAFYGGQSTELENLVKGPGAIWGVAGSMLGPLFQGGRLIESYNASVAAWRESVQSYAQTVLTAFGEVSNSLITQQKLKDIRVQQARAVKALQDSVRLANLRYLGGLASYFEVLEAQQQLFPAENALARTDRDRLVIVVVLYRALGGGWAADDKPVELSVFPKIP